MLVPVAGSVAELLRLPRDELQERCSGADGAAVAIADVIELPPIDGRMEVWAAGVTYRRSREARMAESEVAADVYERVYDAARPELFFKSAAWRVVGHGETVAVRSDSEIDVPEPELALIVNAHAEIVGYSICDDVSSRTIEGDNPLYLPLEGFDDGYSYYNTSDLWHYAFPAVNDQLATPRRPRLHRPYRRARRPGPADPSDLPCGRISARCWSLTR